MNENDCEKINTVGGWLREGRFNRRISSSNREHSYEKREG
jgi:hypothetical protein